MKWEKMGIKDNLTKIMHCNDCKRIIYCITSNFINFDMKICEMITVKQAKGKNFVKFHLGLIIT